SVREVRDFLADKRPDKRARLVENLLEHPRYVTHFTAVYRALLLPEASTSFQLGVQAGGFESWLRGQLAKNAGWDKIATELLTAPVAGGRGGPFAVGGAGPGAFYFAKEFKPEELAGAAGRLFLGGNIGCAPCHPHPFPSWKREQFWGFAALFRRIQSRRMGDFSFPTGEDPSKREITIPGSEKKVQAKFPDGTKPTWKEKVSARATLAEWMTSPDNPYFARAAVNRVWAYFFGMGLIDPVD